jgi:hypothetical protein
MSVTEAGQQAAPEVQAVRGTRFPGFDLTSAVDVPRRVHTKGGGQATPDQLAAHLGYKGTNNGAYLTKVAAAVSFGVLHRVGPVYQPTQLAYSILSPTYQHDQKKALVDAFLNVPLFKQIYEDFKGKELPPEFGMKNALRLTYKVAPNRVNDAYRILMDSAETAGFFETKNGARTHLIMPLIQAVPGAAGGGAPVNEKPGDDLGGGNGGNGGGGNGGDGGDENRIKNPPPLTQSMADVKAKYLSTLIKLFEDKAVNGDVDEKLMERIERLMGATQA